MGEFMIAAAQVASVRGDLKRNLRTHVDAVTAAAERGVSVLIFPELSLTGYELDLAGTHGLAITDVFLDPISKLAQLHHMHVSVGLPLDLGISRPAIGAVLFGPDGSRQAYAKMHLGGGESDHFAPGYQPLAFEAGGETIGLAICADSSAPSHPRAYAAIGATVYAAGVFLNAEWYATDSPRLAAHAARHRMLVVMANHAASVGTYSSVGRSAIWAPDGTLLAQVAGTECALVIAVRELNDARSKWSGQVSEKGSS